MFILLVIVLEEHWHHWQLLWCLSLEIFIVWRLAVRVSEISSLQSFSTLLLLTSKAANIILVDSRRKTTPFPKVCHTVIPSSCAAVGKNDFWTSGINQCFSVPPKEAGYYHVAGYHFKNDHKGELSKSLGHSIQMYEYYLAQGIVYVAWTIPDLDFAFIKCTHLAVDRLLWPNYDHFQSSRII